MIEPAEEIYVVFNKKTGSTKTGGGSSTKPSVHAYLTEAAAWAGVRRISSGYYSPDESGVAKYRLVEAKESRE
nr:MAG TPA: hypothetical protein [Caudoviricetes sp.]